MADALLWPLGCALAMIVVGVLAVVMKAVQHVCRRRPMPDLPLSSGALRADVSSVQLIRALRKQKRKKGA